MDFEQAIKETAKEFQMQAQAVRQPKEEVEETLEETVQPVDLYQTQRQSMRDMAKPRVFGASKKVGQDLDRLLEGGIERAYKKALDDSESQKAQGETQRAEIIRQQYMQDYFMPLVDALIRLNSQEEVLASQDTLKTLDALAMMPGGGRGNGYTSVYVSSLYEPVASQTFTTDAATRHGINRINHLCDTGQMRSAISVAKQLQQRIDMGAGRATPEDYEFLQKIALRG